MDSVYTRKNPGMFLRCIDKKPMWLQARVQDIQNNPPGWTPLEPPKADKSNDERPLDPPPNEATTVQELMTDIIAGKDPTRRPPVWKDSALMRINRMARMEPFVEAPLPRRLASPPAHNRSFAPSTPP